MSFSTDKAALLAVLKEKDCSATIDVYNRLNSYSDIPVIFTKYSKAFDGDNAYLNTVAALFDDDSLMAVGAYYNKTAITISNPKIVAKSTGIIINIDMSGNFGPLEILGLSNITEINIINETHLEYIVIAGSSVVQRINVEPGSSVGVIMVQNVNALPSQLGKFNGNSNDPQEILVEQGATFGGYECNYIPL